MNLRRNQTATRRRGVILLVVLAMLTLFAIAGITFVLYANAASESARISRDAESYSTSFPDMDPSTSFNFFLSQLIYGVDDNQLATPNVNSALRGHSLAETMYGSWDAAGTMPSDVSFNGTGRLHFSQTGPAAIAGQDEFNLVNYMFFQNDGFTHDPSRYGVRADMSRARLADYAGGQNPNYTYPDLNNMFLATIRSSDGTVLQPSYFRSWTGFGSLAASNPNWTSGTADLKYKTLRPRPADMGPGFPLPTNNPAGSPVPAADVKNLVGFPGNNDSIWIDIGAPVLSTAGGLRYKMLVAPLILDLDRCVNLNVAGNILGAAGAHAGNQGQGPWEVNLSKVLNAPIPGPTPAEWRNLFAGNAMRSRYGAGGLPTAVFPLQGPSPHIYFPGDLNGLVDPGQPGAGTATSLYSLPGAGGVPPHASFPSFPANGYGNNAGGFLEVTVSGSGPPYNHPMFFNPLTGSGGNNLFSLQKNASLLWAGVAASPNSDFPTLCPTNFATLDPPTDPNGTKRRILETTSLSMDVDRAGAPPYVFDPNAAPYTISYAPTGYTYGGGSTAFQTLPIPPPPPGPAVPLPAPPPNSEYDASTWRSVLPRMLPRLNLDRNLTAYPAPTGSPPQIDLTNPATAAQYAQALADRQQFASDIFTRLRAATGTVINPMPPAGAQYDSLRWLAQLSANIVDYIDTDDYMTPFQWTTAPAAPDTGYVFGTELPKLVLNEAYVQYNNTPGDAGLPAGPAMSPYQMNVWVELLNPLPNGPDANGSNNAQLQNGANPSIYQVLLTKPNTGLRSPGNILGDPDPGMGQILNPNAQTTPSSNFNGTATQQTVQPVGNNYSDPSSSNVGFYVLGPATDTTLPATLQSANMTYSVPLTDPNRNMLTMEKPTILLRRLANPYLAFNGTAGPGYNPYVTVDYVENVPVQDARAIIDTAPGPNPGLVPGAMRHSYGRSQPYAGAAAQLVSQQPNPPNGGTTPQHTFWRHNATASTPGPNNVTAPAGYPTFDWLVHLDRPLISPVELLNVSGFKPHELTQQFIDTAGNKFQHVAPWTDQNSRLYRLLEFVKVADIMPGVSEGGRIPGKVNINTLDTSELEVFRALCDAQAGNRFRYDNTGTTDLGDGNVDAVFNAILAGRTPTLSGTDRLPGSSDQPFWGMALGAATGGGGDPMGGARGMANTLLAPATPGGGLGTPRLLTPTTLTGTPPYQQMELLNKLFNNVTTRSNTFAVWLTVGFFPITNDQVQPNQLGPEINLNVGRNIRHHMFAIVDRTQIVTFGNPPGSSLNPPITYAGPNIAAGTTGVPIGIPNPIMNAANHTWQIQQNSTLVYDPGLANEETVVVYNMAGNLVADFKQAHTNGANVISRGHPGPIDPVAHPPVGDTTVVPYSVIID